MEIRPLDLTSDDEVHAFYVALRDASLTENPERPIWSEEMLTARMREPTDEVEMEAWGAFGEAQALALLGGAIMFLPQADNLEKAYTGVAVHPDHQRQGIGGALAEHIVGRAAARGRTVVLADTAYAFAGRENHGFRRFAERHGFQLASTEVTRRLDLPVDDEVVQVWIDEAAPYHSDYRIQTFNEIPDELLPSLCYVENQLALEAPTGDIEFEAQQTTPEMHRQARDRDRRAGITAFDTLALDSEGQVVAVSTLTVDASEPGVARQEATIVHRNHRGHRLGLALKAVNLRAVQRTHPDLTAAFTSNHEDNAQMVAINERVGFRPLELHVAFMRTL